ncbi:hypothetical protein COOONC_13914 [Cooperia oncophora]
MERSSTFIPSKERWRIQYGTGDARGVLGTDIVRFGGIDEDQLAVPKTTFGLAMHISADFKTDPTDGILGLAFTSLAENDVVPPLINAINQSKFTTIRKNLTVEGTSCRRRRLPYL